MTKSPFDIAWEVVFRRFFCPETELFYDYVIDDQSNAWHHLPLPDDIKANVPNPCGWGTGMEDSALNGGSALDALVLAYEKTGDPRIKTYTDAILRGMLRCAAEQDQGFIARSVSPFDQKSRYIESSRDQYTHWLYGVFRLYSSPLCDEQQKKDIRRVFAAVADKALRDVTPENDFHMTRADGSVGIVCKMWGGVGTHEALRLPMFYLLAHHVTGDEKYMTEYTKYIDEAIAASLPHRPETMRCYGSLQMQCSLRAIYDLERNEERRAALMKMMKHNADYGQRKALQNTFEFCKPEHAADLSFRFHKWNEVEPRDMGTFGGFTYINPAQSERKDNRAFYPVREVAEGAIIVALCPDYRPNQELISAIERLAAVIDFPKHSSIYAPLLLACAHVTCR